ncbi:conserved hypothetical protein [Pseudomonas sp. 8O]|nr:conserved hypothetical protein [Pseudomonas sp. 8O]
MTKIFNAFGLSRDIPADIKRQVRQRDGFGCVVCGLGIVQYEHVDPEFKDARTHDPNCIALLCPQCHAKVTTRMWSKARVKLAMRSPKCKQLGYTREFFDFSDGHPALKFGGMLLSNCPTPIEVSGKPLFRIKPPELPEEPFLFSGLFTDSEGNISLEIEDNEWKAYSNAWDVEVKGSTITIREAHRVFHLILSVSQPNTIVVERLNMTLGGLQFEANGDFLRVTFPHGGVSEFTSCLADNCMVGMAF